VGDENGPFIEERGVTASPASVHPVRLLAGGSLIAPRTLGAGGRLDAGGRPRSDID
jgi:hypothetical protein